MPERIVHIHIPKTAGTALRSAVAEANNGEYRVFPHYDEIKFVNIAAEDYDFYSGHIGYHTAAALNGNIITVLRNPIDRFVSVYFFWRELFAKGVENSRKTILSNKYSLDEFSSIHDDSLLFEEFFNRATWQLAYGSSLQHRDELHSAGKTEDEIYKMALVNLRSFSVVGIQEQMQQFAAALYQIFAIELRLSAINVTKSRVCIDDIPMQTRQKSIIGFIWIRNSTTT